MRRSRMADFRHLVVFVGRASASIGKAQAMLAQLVMQCLARQAERFGDAAQRTVGTVQFSGDQRALEGFDLFAQAAAAGQAGARLAAWPLQAQAEPEGEALRGVLQLAHVARPGVLQQRGTLLGLQFANRQAVALGGGLGEVLKQQKDVFAAFTQRRNAQGCDV